MTKRFFRAKGIALCRAAFLGGLILALGLFLGGCDNPTGDDKPSAQELAAEEFRDKHWEILEKSLARIALSDEAAINAAMEAYEALEEGAKALLTAEKEKLDGFKNRVSASKGSVAALRTYLAGLPENTVFNPYTVVYTGSGSAGAIYNALGTEGKYVSLDLSQSRVSGFEYNTEPGRALIVELVLPDSLEETPNAANPAAAVFSGFSNLKKASAAGLLTLGDNAFSNCESLEEVKLDKAAGIGASAFEGCTSLAGIRLPAAVTINERAFYGCAKLAAVELPVAADINLRAFYNCASLTSVDFPAARAIGASVFYQCSNLATARLAKAEIIDAWAFYSCGKLVSVYLPEAKTIDYAAFQQCSSLATINLPKAENIGTTENGGSVFVDCVSLTTIILGNTPPTYMGVTLFRSTAHNPMTITFKVPDTQVYIDAGTPWSDMMGTSTDWASYWDSTGSTKTKLTVALAAIE
jgi:hypothetical protein